MNLKINRVEEPRFAYDKEQSEELINSFETDEQTVKYYPLSNGRQMNMFVPKNLAYDIQASLKDCEKYILRTKKYEGEQDSQSGLEGAFATMQANIKRNYIDRFVMEELQLKSLDELYAMLFAEQIDAVALCIMNIQINEGMIVADMAGFGKGRVGACVVRYCILHKLIPVFVTKDVKLFSDFYRDLYDIGMGKIRNFILHTNPDSKIFHELPDIEEPVLVQKPMPPELIKELIEDEDKLPYEHVEEVIEGAKGETVEWVATRKRFDMIMTTYSQFADDLFVKIQKLEKKKDKKAIKRLRENANESQVRYEYLRRIAPNAVFILDESHAAGGRNSSTSEFFKAIVINTVATIYMSATFAKSLQTLPLYAMKTVLREADMQTPKLVKAISKGGNALQEVIAAQLARAGQMIRREHRFDPRLIEYKYIDTPQNEQYNIYNKILEIINRIAYFQHKNIYKTVVAYVERVQAAQTNKDIKYIFKINNVTHQLFQLINNIFLSLKCQATAEECIALLRLKTENEPNGRKPIVAFSQTMESSIDYLDLNVGDVETDLSFARALKRLLDNAMKFQLETWEKIGVEEDDVDFVSKKDVLIKFKELDQESQDEYTQIMKLFSKSELDLPISPIDKLIYLIQKEQDENGRNYVIGEITGRKKQLVYAADGKSATVKSYSVKKNQLIYKFNNNKGVDVLLINASGSTGLSLHASEKFRDKRVRSMVIQQVEVDINIEVQKRGRTFRTGQVVEPEYIYLSSAVPAEKRLFMMLKSKLRSLDSATTATQQGTVQVLQSEELMFIDFMNPLGDELICDYLKENPQFNDDLGDPLGLNKPDKKGNFECSWFEDRAKRVTGKVAFLNTTKQEEFYDTFTDVYKREVSSQIEQGTFTLETQYLNLQATTIEKQIKIFGSGGRSDFGTDTFLEKCEVNLLRKPFKKRKIDEFIMKSLGSKTSQEKVNEWIEELNNFEPVWKAEQLSSLKTKIDNVELQLARLDEKRTQVQAEYNKISELITAAGGELAEGEEAELPTDFKAEGGELDDGEKRKKRKMPKSSIGFNPEQFDNPEEEFNVIDSVLADIPEEQQEQISDKDIEKLQKQLQEKVKRIEAIDALVTEYSDKKARLNASYENKVMKLENDFNDIRKLLPELQVGHLVRCPELSPADKASYTRGDESLHGIPYGSWSWVIDVKINKKHKNPFAPSNVSIVIATLDGRRKVSVVATDKQMIDLLIYQKSELTNIEFEEISREWDKMAATLRRENAEMITGNILQGFGFARGGTIMKYTNDRDEFKYGIKLFKRSKEEREADEGRATVNIRRKAEDILELPIRDKDDKEIELKQKYNFFTTLGELYIRRISTGLYEIAFDSRAGDIFITDNRILDMIQIQEGNEKPVFTDGSGYDIVNGKRKKLKTKLAVVSRSRIKDLIDYIGRKYNLRVYTQAVDVDIEEHVEKIFSYYMQFPPTTENMKKVPQVGIVRFDFVEGEPLVINKNEYSGVVEYTSELSINTLTTYSLIPKYESIDEPIEKFINMLSPKQHLEFKEKILAAISGNMEQLYNFILRNIPANANFEFYFGVYTKEQVANRIIEVFQKEGMEKLTIPEVTKYAKLALGIMAKGGEVQALGAQFRKAPIKKYGNYKPNPIIID